jgi:cold shock CspA family protein
MRRGVLLFHFHGHHITVGYLKSFGNLGVGFFSVEGEPDVFAHANQFKYAGLDPVVDSPYEFDIDTGVDGRVRARNIRKVPADE